MNSPLQSRLAMACSLWSALPRGPPPSPRLRRWPLASAHLCASSSCGAVWRGLPECCPPVRALGGGPPRVRFLLSASATSSSCTHSSRAPTRKELGGFDCWGLGALRNNRRCSRSFSTMPSAYFVICCHSFTAAATRTREFAAVMSRTRVASSMSQQLHSVNESAAKYLSAPKLAPTAPVPPLNR